MKESEFAKRIEETMAFLNLRWHHETDSRKSKAGFPDYCVVGPYGVMFLEIKATKGKVSPEQQAWLDDIHRVATWDQGQIEQVLIAYAAWPKDWDRVLSDLKRIAGKG